MATKKKAVSKKKAATKKKTAAKRAPRPYKRTGPELSAEIEGDNLVVTIPLLNEPKPSHSGKQIVLTRDQRETSIKVKGQNVTVGVHASIPA